MERKALGLIETIGLVAALEAADAAVKSANIRLVGYELSKGGGLVTVKLEGDVGAVNAAVLAGCNAAQRLNSVYASKVIPRPHEELKGIIHSRETVGRETENPQEEEPQVPREEEPIGPSPYQELEEEEKDRQETMEAQEEMKSEPTCNLCHDIKCPRQKGELKTTCIHYNESH